MDREGQTWAATPPMVTLMRPPRSKFWPEISSRERGALSSGSTDVTLGLLWYCSTLCVHGTTAPSNSSRTDAAPVAGTAGAAHVSAAGVKLAAQVVKYSCPPNVTTSFGYERHTNKKKKKKKEEEEERGGGEEEEEERR